MLKIFILISLVSLLFSRESLNYIVSDKHAYILPNKKADISVEYLKLNDTLDIFNIKSQELGSLSNYGSIGDMDGYGIDVRYGLKNAMLNLKILKQDIEYGSGTLRNLSIGGYYRHLLFQSNFGFINSVSADIGFKSNRASDMSYSDPKFLEPLAKKVLDVKDARIIANNDGTYTVGIIKKDGVTTDTISGMSEKPTLFIKDMSDSSLFVRILSEKKLNSKAYLSLFLQYTKTNIKTFVTANDELNEEAKAKGYNTQKNLDRDEDKVSIGTNISLEWKNLVWELTYTYSKIFKDSGLDYIDYNHVVQASIAKKVNKKLIIYLGSKLMYRQFNGEIPYLYNKYTQTTFDHKYGYVRFGLKYSF